MQAERLGNRYNDSLGSSVTRINHRPISAMDSLHSKLSGPIVSNAIGINWYETRRPSEYLWCLCVAAFSTVALSEFVHVGLGADVDSCGILCNIYIPLAHGVRVTPSSLFPSDQRRPRGSFVLGNLAF